MSNNDHLIMLVEDEADIRELIRDALNDHDHQTIAACNGADAIAQLRTHQPCIIVLDALMPDMDGWEFRRAQLAAPELADIPVVVLTAAANAELTAAELTAVDYLRKPATIGALLAMIERNCRHACA